MLGSKRLIKASAKVLDLQEDLFAINHSLVNSTGKRILIKGPTGKETSFSLIELNSYIRLTKIIMRGSL